MARSSLLDMLQDHRFWIADNTPQFGVDSLDTIPFWALSPMLGFARCTAPSYEADVKQVTPGGSHRSISVIRRVSSAPITMARGALWWDSDFHRWMMRGAHGIGVPRRDLMLIQYMHTAFDINSPGGMAAVLGAGAVAGLGAGLAGGGAAGISGAGGASISAVSMAASQLALAGMATAFGDDALIRVPARAWSLVGCVPTAYRPSGDFDATSGQISIAELTVQPEYADEITLAG
jgi:phage tail-like protein